MRLAPSPTPATSDRPAATPTPSPSQEWELQYIDIDGSTVKVMPRMSGGELITEMSSSRPEKITGGI